MRMSKTIVRGACFHLLLSILFNAKSIAHCVSDNQLLPMCWHVAPHMLKKRAPPTVRPASDEPFWQVSSSLNRSHEILLLRNSTTLDIALSLRM